MAQLVKYSCTDNFSCRFSKKRRYQSDADHEDYNDGSSSLKDDAKWILDMSKVAARFCRNHASVHTTKTPVRAAWVAECDIHTQLRVEVCHTRKAPQAQSCAWNSGGQGREAQATERGATPLARRHA